MKYTITFTGLVPTEKHLEVKGKCVLAGLSMSNVRDYIVNLGINEFLKDADKHIEVIKNKIGGK